MLIPILAAALMEPTPAEAAMTACLGKPDAERLACFDAAASLLGGEPSLGPLVRPGADAAPMEAPRPPVIGAQAETAPPRTVPMTEAAPEPAPEPSSDFGLSKRADPKQPITVAVQSVELNGRGKATVTLADGQVWRQLNSDSVTVSRGRARRAEMATIKRGALGSYRMTIEPSGRTIRVKRLR